MIKNHYGKLIYITTGSVRYTMPNGAIAFATAKSGWLRFQDILHKNLEEKV